MKKLDTWLQKNNTHFYIKLGLISKTLKLGVLKLMKKELLFGKTLPNPQLVEVAGPNIYIVTCLSHGGQLMKKKS